MLSPRVVTIRTSPIDFGEDDMKGTKSLGKWNFTVELMQKAVKVKGMIGLEGTKITLPIHVITRPNPTHPEGCH